MVKDCYIVAISTKRKADRMEVQAGLAERVRRRVDEMRGVGPLLRPHLLPLLGLTIVLGVLYWGTLRWLWNAWMTNDYYTHGILMPVVAAFFAWRARRAIAAQTAAPARIADLWLASVGIVLYAVAFRAHDPFYYSLSLLTVLAGIALYILGWKRARHLALPLAFLLLAIPLPFLLSIGVELQKIAATGTALLMTLFGVPVVQDKFLLHAGSLTFEVVPLCSGLSSSISITALTAIVAAISPMRNWARGTLLALAIPIALAANILRIAITIWVGMTWGTEASQGFLHGASSLVLFLLALSLVLGASILLNRISKKVSK